LLSHVVTGQLGVFPSFLLSHTAVN
jgi:hypothetical protein